MKAFVNNIITKLQSTADERVKGSAIVCVLNPQGKFSAIVVSGGLQFPVTGIPETMRDHVIFSEARNQ